MEVNKKQLADIFGASIRTIQNWQEQGMPVLMNLSTAPMRSPLNSHSSNGQNGPPLMRKAGG
ncbi:phage DNA packaging protein [Escherichia coli]|nr:phage DNA packaging protein [Escherichia coli]